MNKKYKLILAPLLFLVSFVCVIQINAAGEVDTGFNAQAYIGEFDVFYNQVNKIIG